MRLKNDRAHPLRCRCGTLTGLVRQPQKGSRGVCYCTDCQAYAHQLGNPKDILDEAGGTDVVATLPKYLSFTGGVDALACLSLTGRGMLRWYAKCCGTPVGNTLRSYRFPYVGLVHSCLGAPEAIEASFGPVRMRVNIRSAKGRPKPMPMSQALALLRFAPTVLMSRLDGSYRTTPFFSADGRPLVQPKVLTSAELEAAKDAVRRH